VRGFHRSRASSFWTALLSTRPPSNAAPSLYECPHSTRNFDLELAIATTLRLPAPAYAETGTNPVVYGGDRAGLSRFGSKAGTLLLHGTALEINRRCCSRPYSPNRPLMLAGSGHAFGWAWRT
jgi:hypothetical protein